MDNKKCPKCGEIKSLDDFHKDSRAKDQHAYSCKMCINKYEKFRRNNYNLDNKRTHKKCPRCGLTKPTNKFSTRGWRTYCKKCNSERVRNIRNKDRKLSLEREGQWRKNRPTEIKQKQCKERVNWQRENKWNQRLCTKLKKEYGTTLRQAPKEILEVIAIERLLILKMNNHIDAKKAMEYYHLIKADVSNIIKELYNYNTGVGVSHYVFSNNSTGR